MPHLIRKADDITKEANPLFLVFAAFPVAVMLILSTQPLRVVSQGPLPLLRSFRVGASANLTLVPSPVLVICSGRSFP